VPKLKEKKKEFLCFVGYSLMIRNSTFKVDKRGIRSLNLISTKIFLSTKLNSRGQENFQFYVPFDLIYFIFFYSIKGEVMPNRFLKNSS
jgi:hypothetical protein